MIIPSLMAGDLLNLETEVKNIINANINMIHLDIMDHNYVPNLTFGPMFCQALHTIYPKLLLDVHIMALDVDSLIEEFAIAHATRISIHADAAPHLDRNLQKIRSLGCLAGLVLNPADDINIIKWVEHRLDFILIMTVNPGFSGQAFIEPMLDKIKMVRQIYPKLKICVDGGVNLHIAKILAGIGVQECISGADFFSSKNYQKTAMEYMQVFKV